MADGQITNKDLYDMAAKLEEEIKDFRKEVKDGYVTQDRFAPVEKLVYGLTGLLMTAILVAMLAQVLQT